MDLILDTSVLIAGERLGQNIRQILRHLRILHGDIEIGMSAISVVETTHGIYRAKSDSDRERRRIFCEELYRDVTVHPVSLQIAQLAGRIEGQQAAIGNVIAFEDLVIGATALHLRFGVATLNVRHFQRIPDLNVIAI